MKRIKRPLAGLALLGAASVAVVAAATVWLYTGWTTIGLTLTDRIGSGAQELQGFTLEGALEWHDNSDSLYFRLQDGALHTEFWMDKRPPEAPGLSYWPAMVVPAAEHAPADARTALAGAAMEGGFTLLLYLDGEDTLWADLVTAAGQRADHRELGALPAADLYDATLQPRTATREAVVSVLCNQAVEGGGYVGNGGVLAALRVENGRFTVARTLENDGAGAEAAVLNEAGDAVLTADVLSNTYQYWGDSMGQTLGTSLSDHVRLKVYDLTNGNMTYQGMLHTGDDAAWLPEEQPRPSTIFIFSIEPQEAAP